MTRPIVQSEVRPRTLAGLLAARAAERPERDAYLFLANGEADRAERLTWGELDARARAVAAALAASVPPGERALLLFPPGLDFIAAFFGCLYAGVVAVPAYLPRPNDRSPARLAAIVRDAAPRAALTTAALAARVRELAALRSIAVDALPRQAGSGPLVEPDPRAIAFLQYTSGSTADPRGVMVSHENLLHNERMIGEAFGVGPESVVVGWLPLHHDMGLIGNVLQPLHAGAVAVLMSPVAFLQRPRRWLEAIDRYRGTTSGGPNFAYDLCVRKIPPAAREGLDLASWRVAFNGAEPVRAFTLERFAEAFAANGFRRQAFYPCYGLAEATLFVAGPERGRAPRVEEVDAAALARGAAEVATAGDRGASRPLVGCGTARGGQTIAVVDPERGAELSAGEVGEIWVAGESVARGYWGNPEATARDFGARLAGREGERFLRTGDLGFALDGELFVTGRIKDLIIVRGRNLYPQDLELTAERSHAGLRPGGGAAFAVDSVEGGEDGERLVIVQEVERGLAGPEGGSAELAEIAAAVRRAVAEEHEAQPHEVILVRAGAVPKTSSGKVRRAACREMLLAGEIEVLARSVAGEGDEEREKDGLGGEGGRGAGLAGIGPETLAADEREDALVEVLRARAAAAMGVGVAAIDADRPLTGLGLDSLSAVEIQGAVEAELGASLSLSDLLEGATVRELARTLAGHQTASRESAAAKAARPAPPTPRHPERSEGSGGGEVSEVAPHPILRSAQDDNLGPVAGIEPSLVSDRAEAGDQPLSPGQRALWFLERLAPEAGAYNIAVAARARGLDASRFRLALERLVARHPALRTTFAAEGEEPVARVSPRGVVDFEVADATDWSEARVRARLAEDAWRPFDLERGPLVRARVLARADGDAAILFAVHHIVADFASLAILARELGSLYGAGERAPLEPAEAGPGELLRRQAARLAGEAGETLWEFWREALGGPRGPVPDLALPTDRPRPPVQTWRGVGRGAAISAAEMAGVRRLAREEGASLFALLAAAWQVQLGRYAGQEDFAVGMPTSGRGAAEAAGVVGYLVNAVPLRADLAGDGGEQPSFADVLARARRAAVAALDHAALPFVLLAERLRPLRDPARPPLFQVVLTLEQGRPGDDPGLAAFALGEEGARIALGGVELISLALPERRASFELSLAAADLPGGGLGLSLTANADLFDAATAQRMLGHLATLLAGAVADPAARWTDLPLLSAAERQQLAREWSDAAPAEDAAPVHELFAAQAARRPDAVALSVADGAWTYGELAWRANRLARRLVGLGAGPGVLVGLCAERSAGLILGVLAILEAGGAYLPLDPAHPAERLAFTLEDAGAPIVLAEDGLRARLPAGGARVVSLDDLAGGDGEAGAALPATRVDPGELAYVIYTSGSTGRPKGVAVTHANAARLFAVTREAYALGPGDVWTLFHSIAFDFSVWELWGALAFGGRLVVVPGETARSSEAFYGLLRDEQATVLNQTPSAFRQLVWSEESALARGEAMAGSLRLVIFGGEALDLPSLAPWLERHDEERPALVNMYGITETTVHSTWRRIRRRDLERAGSVVGRPLPDLAIHLLDDRGRPLPIGVPGEIHVGGASVARGYLHRPDLTAERFVPDPFLGARSFSDAAPGARGLLSGALGARLYRSGDLARWRPEGDLEYLGRIDRQVKVRGYRIELGEIEAALAEHPAVREAAVVAREDRAGDARLVGYVSLAGEPAPPPSSLAAFLAERLPGYMVPAAWVVLDRLPLTANGKVDRAALPAPEERGSGGAYLAPRGPIEEGLAGIWKDLLGRQRVGAEDDFFALGGHSLLATRAVAQASRLFGVDLPVAAIFTSPTVAGLAAQVSARLAALAGQKLDATPPIHPARRLPGEPIPLSFAQRRLWFLERLAPGTAVYNVPGAVDLAGPLDAPALAGALAEVARRHEALRASFPADLETGGEPAQRIAPTLPLPLPLVDLAGLPADRLAAAAARLAREEARQLFDLARGPLLRARLLRLGRGDHRLLVTFHHLAADGWSLGIFLDELAAAYEALAAGRRPALPPLPVQYADFAAWQSERLRGETLARELAYWRERLAGLPVLELPVDRQRPPSRDPRGATRAVVLDDAEIAAVDALARRRGVTRFMALLALFQTLLARWTGEESVAVGSPVANRRRPEVEGLIGLFVNTLVLDARVGDDPALGDLLARARQACLGAYAHQDLPFERLVEELQPERDRGQNPLFQVVFAVDEPLPARAAGGLAWTPRRRDSGTAKFDLTATLSPRPEGGGWELLAEHPLALWDAATIDRLLGHFHNLVTSATAMDAAGRAARLSDLALLSVPERQQLAVEWNDTAADLAAPGASGARIQDLIAAQAARRPDAVAVVAGSARLTYRELVERARRLGARLAALGVRPERRVGLAVERGPQLVLGVLGILEAGGVYVPLDPAHPRERVAYMLADSGAEVLLTERSLAARFAFAGPTLLLDDEEGLAALPEARPERAGDDNLAYVIYTSGSTGRPKGVAIAHRSAVNMVRWTLALFSPEELGGSLAATSVGFDVSIFELFAPLAAGGRLILARDLTALPGLAEAAELALVTGVPSPIAELAGRPAGSGLPAGARAVNLGGEALRPDLVARLYAEPQVERVWNLYGPAENTTYSTCSRVPRGASHVTVGRPVANAGARVLGRWWWGAEPQPAGVPGELAVFGASLARGYLGRPDLTAERFVPDPLGHLTGSPGARMYRTGDRARLLPNGEIDYLGRLDHQVKLRGVRIELGEIEAQLEEHPQVRQGVVLLRNDPPAPRLVAYLVGDLDSDLGAPSVPDIDRALAAFLRDRLPAAMIPSAWVVLPALPLSPNGKVDRRALPAPDLVATGAAAPRNAVEERLAALFGEVLGREGIGIHDSFFDLGGHSLLALRAAFRLSESLGVEVPVAAIFEAPTIAELAELAERLASAGGLSALASPTSDAPDDGRYPLSAAQQRLWFLDRLAPGGTVHNLQVAVRLAGGLDAAALGRALAEIVRRHEPLRTVYPEREGEPYQEILPPPEATALDCLSLASLPAADRDAALAAALAAEERRPFDLRRGPVVRFLLIEEGPREHVLSVTFHHIATDGWSLGLFARELAALYGAFVAGRPSPLPAPALRYRDAALAERRALAGAGVEGDLRYWREALAGLPALDLPADRPRPSVAPATPRAVSAPVAIDAPLAAALGELARQTGATPFAVLYAAFATLLARWSGQEDFGVGIPVAGRSRPETQAMIGLFVNTLVLRAPLGGDPGFRELVARARETTLAAQAHQEVPFERLVDELQPARQSNGRSPLFQAMLAYLSDPQPPLAMPGLRASLLDLPPAVAEFDLTLSLHEWEGRLAGWLVLSADLFAAATAARLAGHLQALLAGIAADPSRRISDLPLLSEAERRQALAEGGISEPARAIAAHRLVEGWARRAPDAVALLSDLDGDETTITYGELEARANRLARHLLSLGLAPEARVAVCLERSTELDVAFLAALKAGGVHLPIDPGYPPERMLEMIVDSGAAAVVAEGDTAALLPLAALPSRPVLVLVDRDAAAIGRRSAAPPEVEVDPRALAYVIYTSGSTGRPKGVAVSHEALAAHLLAVTELYGHGPGQRALQFGSPGFDVAVEQVMATLGSGATLVLRGAELWGTREMTRRAAELGLTFFDPPTAYWHRWASDPGEAPAGSLPLRLVLTGGEAMLAENVRRWMGSPLAGVPLLNGYGPTEAVVTSLVHAVRREDGELPSIPIGRPLRGRSAWVIDRAFHLQPVGSPGELALGGPLARGYLGRPDLTAERFVPDPFSGQPGARLYRTGDRVRRLADGELDFLGRLDGQVKVRGFRVELGEVEAALTSHPAVREAAAGALPGAGGDRYLAAWVVPADPAVMDGGGGLVAERDLISGRDLTSGHDLISGRDLISELRAALRARLPEHMVPSAWAVLPALPLTRHGKVDRRALPPPALADAGPAERPSAASAPPGSPEAEIVAGLFAELTGRERVGAEESFFDLGGHSLLATQLASRLTAVFGVELPLAAIFDDPTPAALARRLIAARRAAEAGGGDPGLAAPSLVREGGDTAPLSFAQQRLWFLHQLEPDDAYHVPGALRLRGALREEILARAIEEIVRRHESLRTVFRGEGSAAVQVVLPTVVAEVAALPVADLAALPPDAREAEAARLLAAEGRRPFDLAAGPLLRTLLVRLAPDAPDAEGGDRLLSVVMHHIVSDAWSLGGMLRELSALYAAFAAGEGSPLAPLAIQYPDFARWQRRFLSGPVLAREVAHWRRALAGAPESLALPYDRPPAPGTGNRGGRVPFALSPALYGALAALARRQGWTPFMALLAGFQALLARYAGEERVVVGSPIANRNRLELEGLIGFLTNTLALPLDLAGDPSFAELGRRVRAVALDAYAHQDLPFEKLVEELAPDRHLGRNPIFQTMLVLQRLPPPPALPGVEVEMLDVDTGTAKFDLTLMLVEGEDGGAAGSLELARALFDEATAERLLVHFETLLAGAVADPGRRLAELPLLPEVERAELAAWTAPLAPAPPALLVHARVAAQAARRPDALAAVFDGAHLTYAALLGRARSLARRLRALGVGPDVPVALFLGRSLDMMVAVLAVLEAGGAYLPLDPSYPAERLRAMLEDARAPVLLTHGALAAAAPPGAGRIVRVDDPSPEEGGEPPLPDIAVSPEHLAYLVYTSGSTGRPKGVAMTHGAIGAMLLWQLRTSAAGSERTLQFTSLSFDVSFQEIFSTWWAGGALVLVAEDERRDPPALARRLAEESVGRLFLPFVALQQVALAAASSPGEAFPASLREVMSAGEQLYVTPQVAALFARLPGAGLHNHYGPSEAHAVTWLALEGDAAEWPERPSIGRPVDHARVFLLDAWLQPAPAGVPGEIWVGGAGLARGYFDRPELTAERFLPDPFDWAAGWRPGDRIYRTGDLARRRPDGNLEFLGRHDAQVKIRGHRVELAEVETALARHPAVQQAAVAARGEGAGARRLVAYVVFREGAAVPTFGELRDLLAESLPDTMIPAAWTALAELPLTATGKLDRRALARIEPAEVLRGGAAFAPPQTPAEELLAGIWREVLGVSRVGRHDDFFDLGGHSLLATQVASRVRQLFGVELPLRRVFQAPALDELALAIVEERDGAPTAPAPPPLRREPRTEAPPLSFAPLSFGQERLWFLDRLRPGDAAYNVPLALAAAGALDPARLAAALAGVVRRHEVLRTIFAERDGSPVQVILPAPSSSPLSLVDLSALPAARRGPESRHLAEEDAVRPFDLARGPLLRAALVDLGMEREADRQPRSLLLLALHHVVADGWSLGPLVQEMKALYAGRELPELPIQYADFALWQRRWLAGEALERQLAWWRERLAGASGMLDLPADHPRPPLASQRGADLALDLAPGLGARLAAAVARRGATPFMVLGAALFAFLERITGQADLTLGAPIANRTRLETERLVGFFVNTLVLRADVSRARTFGDLVAQVREASLGAFAHQDLPFEKLVDELRPERELSRTPLFSVVLLLQNAPLPKVELGGVRLAAEEMPVATAKFDLTFAFVPAGDDLSGTLQYSTDLFEPTTAARLARAFGRLLAGLLADLETGAERALAATPLLGEAERHQLLREWNDTDAPYAREATVVDLLAARFASQPDAIAAVWEGEHLTYGALAARARRLAGHLSGRGAGPGTPVAVWMERSLDAVVAVVGALSAGSHYVPLDPSWPTARAEAILGGIGEGGRAPLLLTRRSQLPAVDDLRSRLPLDVLCLDAETAAECGSAAAAHLLTPPGPEDVAYVIHTSGSTGAPKGIAVQHRPLVNHFGWVNGGLGVGPGDRLLFVNSPGFDLSIYDLLGTLAAGGTIQVAPEGALRDPERLARLLVEEPVTVWHSAPAALLQLASYFPAPPADLASASPADRDTASPADLNSASPLRLVMLAGDWIPLTLPAQIHAAFPRAVVLNLGGATETSVWSNTYRIDAVDPRWAAIPYGRPIANARYHVLDAELAPCPIGVAGDMYIGGEVLSLGYTGRPEATAERFVPDPFAAAPGARGARLWATGDRGRYAADGNLEFLGRVDQQVKVRGYRIELGEIEVALARHPGVREAAVVAREDVPGEPRLVAYLVPAAAAVPTAAPEPAPEPAPQPAADRTAELRAFLQASLPEYMVPWAFVEMPRLPVTGNGKLDRAALPAPRDLRAADAERYVAPRNDLERAIDAVWREVLGVEKVGVQESFFQAGGSSLLLARLQGRLRESLGRDVPFVELFQHPTIESLARHLQQAAGEAPAAEAPAERVRARTDARRESLRQMQQRGRRRQGGGGGRGERDE